VKTLRNLCIGAAAAAVLGIGAASAQETAKPADKPAVKSERSHRHGGSHRGDHGCRHEGGARHEQQKDGKHEHDGR